MSDKLTKLMHSNIIFLDGAMGTMLQNSGLPLGERPEIMCLTNPDLIRNIHKSYIESGSNIIYANTFGSNSLKLANSGHSTADVIKAAVGIAVEAAKGTECLVGLDIGPIGELLEPSGTLKFEEAYDLYKEMIIEGAASGVDLIAFETMTDLYEVKAGVLAAKENSSLPIFVTMTFEDNHRTFTGCCVEAMACVLEGLGVDAVGINCSLGPDEILPIARELASCTNLPIIIKANAGMPDPLTGNYNIDPDMFTISMAEYLELGVKFIGGCCGTSPDYISALSKTLGNIRHERILNQVVSRVCTPTKVVKIEGVKVIGERINPTGKKRFKQALIENDIDYIISQGVQQADAGASILDVNVGLPEIDETEMMIKVVKNLQSVLDLPLQIDSSDPKAIEAGLRVYNGKAIVNSVNGDEEVLEAILPIAKKYGAAVVGLTLDKNGVPNTSEKRFEIAERILTAAIRHGIKKEDVYIDCLTLTVSAQQEQASETINALKRVKGELGLNTVLGVSNISFGLPYRELINQTFLTMAMTNGLSLPIINPNVNIMMDAVNAFNVLSNHDKESAFFIHSYANADKEIFKKTAKPDGSSGTATTVSFDIPDNIKTSLNHAIEKGMKEEAKAITTRLILDHTELEVVDHFLIPALDAVGNKFERGELFLPQLLSAANASQEAFSVVKSSIEDKGGTPVSKGKIILATVKGDIHDIGKNIVKVILENYGYKIIDLGRDVEPKVVVETALREKVNLIGLSALMTTTLKNMQATIKALRESGHKCIIMVGGAVLTQSYSNQIGADYYSSDAKGAVDIAKKVLGQ